MAKSNNANIASDDFSVNVFTSNDTTISDSRAVTLAINNWYKEGLKYNYDNPEFSEYTQHFTQIVWNESQELGTAITRCENELVFTCVYKPSGNHRNTFPQNVNYP